MVFIPFTLLCLGASALSVQAQITPAPTATASLGNAPRPLTQYTFSYPSLPEKVNPFRSGRGPQSGYNICNSTTEGPDSQCQTMFVNSIEDFCLWGGPKANSVVGDIEAIAVAYCTKPGYGTRLIPPGTLTAVQFIKTTGYIQLTGLLNQTGVGIKAGDGGGELDPHGADLAGNPLGGLVFSNNLPSSKGNSTITQVRSWTNFMGGGMFCIKACDPTVTSPNYCENIFDTQGCFFNMPASYAPNEFTSCQGENQAPPGGNPVIPATSSCTTYTSSLLYPNSATSTSGAASGTASSSSSRSGAPAAATTAGNNGTRSTTQSGAGFFAVVASILLAAFAGIAML